MGEPYSFALFPDTEAGMNYPAASYGVSTADTQSRTKQASGNEPSRDSNGIAQTFPAGEMDLFDPIGDIIQDAWFSQSH